MKPVVFYVVATLSICLSAEPNWAANKTTEEDVLGNWVLPENGSEIQIYQCNDYVCVKVVKVADNKRRDIHNPTPALRNRALAGIVISKNFLKVGEAKWRGRLYNTLDGVTYDGSLNLIDKNTITMVGCVFEGLFCEAKTFYRGNTQRLNSGRTQTDHSRNVSVSPPLPTRKPPQIQLSSLRTLFDEFLTWQSAQNSRSYTQRERDALFKGFSAWLERQPATNTNKIAEQLKR